MNILQRRRGRKRLRKENQPISIGWQIFYGVLVLLVVVFLGVFVWYATRLAVFTITEVTIEGGETIAHEKIESLAEQQLTGSYLLLIPHRFTYLYPHDRIIETIESIPRAHDVVVERRGNKKLHITFAEYIPHALWCLGAEETAECYFLDTSGYAFAPAPPLRGNALTRHVIEGAHELYSGQVLPPSTIGTIDVFTHALESELGFRVSLITHTEVGDITYHVNGGGDLLVAPSMTPEETFENLQSVLTSEEFGHITPGSFNYIDLRFGNKVFVNEELETASSTEEAMEVELEFE